MTPLQRRLERAQARQRHHLAQLEAAAQLVAELSRLELLARLEAEAGRPVPPAPASDAPPELRQVLLLLAELLEDADRRPAAAPTGRRARARAAGTPWADETAVGERAA